MVCAAARLAGAQLSGSRRQCCQCLRAHTQPCAAGGGVLQPAAGAQRPAARGLPPSLRHVQVAGGVAEGLCESVLGRRRQALCLGRPAAVTPGAALKQVAVPQQARGSSPPLFTARGLFLAHFLTKQAACGTLQCFVCSFELKVFSPLSPATLLMKFA